MNHLVSGGGVLSVVSQSKYALRMALVLTLKSASPMLPPNKSVQLTWLRRAAIFAGIANSRIHAVVKSRIKCVVYVLVHLLMSVIVRSVNLQYRHATNANR
jgi:hypothetical protein